jgi:hypothetical protein
MSTLEMKKRIIQKIRKMENEDLLNEVNRLIEIETSDIEVYKFSNEEKAIINEARNQIKNGQYLTDEEASKEINEWLKK